jgi:hypothetical protein
LTPPSSTSPATAKFLYAYVVQTRAGWGNGPLIGSFSTPFERVVQAAIAARKNGGPFATVDATPDLTAPELHGIALAQTAATDDWTVATVLSVIVIYTDGLGDQPPFGLGLRTSPLPLDQFLISSTKIPAPVVCLD